jgi:ribosomal protein S18 acetylase RimI-like enzyme
MSPDIRIQSWHPDFKSAFFELNRAWIEKDYPLEALEALEEARRLGADRVILYSNTKNNGPAIRLYHKLGFQETLLEPGVYKRADIKMEINLHP